MEHYSDCAIWNEPALPRGECDCGGLKLTGDANHDLVIASVARSRRGGNDIGDMSAGSFVEPQELPADGLIADTPTPGLPDTHNSVPLPSGTDGVNFNSPKVPVIGKL